MNSSKNFNGMGMIEGSMNQMWDMWRFTMNSMSAVHDQMENSIKAQLDQNRQARQQFNNLVNDFSNRAYQNQSQLQDAVDVFMGDTSTQSSRSSKS
ncbi:MAG: hypothetical protein ABRQ24_02210 [Syntrophomonadaceae bacterium]